MLARGRRLSSPVVQVCVACASYLVHVFGNWHWWIERCTRPPMPGSPWASGMELGGGHLDGCRASAPPAGEGGTRRPCVLSDAEDAGGRAVFFTPPPRPPIDRSACENIVAKDASRSAMGPRESGPWRRGRQREGCYLVDPASSHMLVSKIKPCMCKYERFRTVKLRMAH